MVTHCPSTFIDASACQVCDRKTFPELFKVGEAFPIKIGMTTGLVEQRVASQCKSAAIFSKPVILGSWPVKRARVFEAAIHTFSKCAGSGATMCLASSGSIPHRTISRRSW